jgi:hypothetical protein
MARLPLRLRLAAARDWTLLVQGVNLVDPAATRFCAASRSCRSRGSTI